MPRGKRERSESGIYHIILRGINRQRIFEDEADREAFLRSLDRSLERSGAILYAWCLMSNHVHLLLQERSEGVDIVMKRLGSGYVRYYNQKNGRVGPLFQDRFRSEPVKDREYWLTVLRYIHQNPVKAKLCRKCSEWRYSSYGEYAGKAERVDTSMLKAEMDIEQFQEWVEQPNGDICLDVAEQRETRLRDDKVVDMIAKTVGTSSITDFQALPEEEQERALRKMQKKGASIRQLQRLTGLSYYAVRKASKS